MTEKEAIKRIKECMNTPNFQPYQYMNEALNAAITALEENQQYRATGLTPQMIMDLIKSEKNAHKAALENAHIVDEYNNGWIPCSERLPEKHVKVLISFKNYNGKHMCCQGRFNGEYFYTYEGTRAHVIAWRPLPEPYKEK